MERRYVSFHVIPRSQLYAVKSFSQNCATHASYDEVYPPESVTVTWNAPENIPLNNTNFV